MTSPPFPDRGSLWLHRYALFVALMTLLLIIAGGMVTSTGSGLSVPDWPTTFHQNMFAFPISKWVGGIFYEHGHRLVASTVGFLTIILAVWLHWCEPRLSVRILGWLALAAVIAQGVLGGLTVLFLLPTWISVFHATLAQTFFCIVISIAVFTSHRWKQRRESSIAVQSNLLHRACLLLVAVVFLQLLLGALMRHSDAGLAVPDFPLAYGQLFPNLDPSAVEQYNQRRAFDYLLPPVTRQQIAIHLAHRLGAAIVTVILLITTSMLLRRHHSVRSLRRPALTAIFLLITQISLGGWTVWSHKTAEVATAHVAVGALTLAACWILTLNVYGTLAVTKRASASTTLIMSEAAA